MKKVFIDFGDVRIKEYNEHNHVVEVLKETVNPKTKEEITSWHFEGYSPNLKASLQLVNRKELLMDKRSINDMESMLYEMNQSTLKLQEAISKLDE